MENTLKQLTEPYAPSDGAILSYVSGPSWTRFAVAFGVAALSDALSFWTEFVPPVQWTVDLLTAALLFVILGRRWAILPGLVAEAIPALAVFPVWVLVVLSITVSKQ